MNRQSAVSSRHLMETWSTLAGRYRHSARDQYSSCIEILFPELVVIRKTIEGGWVLFCMQY